MSTKWCPQCKAGVLAPCCCGYYWCCSWCFTIVDKAEFEKLETIEEGLDNHASN